MSVPMHRLSIHQHSRIMKARFGLIVGTWSSLAVADELTDGHPSWKEGGADASDPNIQVIYECWAPERLRGFPWDRLQALKTRIAK